MNKILTFISLHRGRLFFTAGAVILFLIWRVAGLPCPGSLGRIIPVMWLLCGVVFPSAKIPELSIALLIVASILMFFWSAGEAVYYSGLVVAVAGIFPGIFLASQKKGGVVRAIIPFIPILILIVPFTGDEPFNFALAESILKDQDLNINNNLRQLDPFSEVSPFISDTVEGVSYHQPLFAILLIPGLPFGIPGVRLISLVFALAAGLLLSGFLKDAGFKHAAGWGAAALLLMPGVASLGLAYPAWLVVGLTVLAMWLGWKGKLSITGVLILAITVALIKIRFAALGTGFLIVWFYDQKREKRIKAVVMFVTAVILILIVDKYFLGGRLFWIRYGNIYVLRIILYRTLDKFSTILAAPLGILLDTEAGLLFKAPWVLLAFPGLFYLFKFDRKLFRWVFIPSVLYILILILWMPGEWHGAPTPVCRLMIPLLPMFIASAACMMRKGIGAGLLKASVILSSIYLVFPILRFNAADGSDRLLTALSRSTGFIYTRFFPSMIRPEALLFILWGIAAIIVLYILHRGKREGMEMAIAVSIFIGALAAYPVSVFEAEDLDGEFRQGGSLFPESPNPDIRTVWMRDTQRMLKLSNPSDRLYFPVPPGSDPVVVAITGVFVEGDSITGIRVSCGDDFREEIRLVSTLLPAPGWVNELRGSAPELEFNPGNMRDTTLTFTIHSCSDSVIVVSPVGVSVYDEEGFGGVYLDRIELR